MTPLPLLKDASFEETDDRVQAISLATDVAEFFFFPTILIREHRHAWGEPYFVPYLPKPIEARLAALPRWFRRGSSFSVSLSFGICLVLAGTAGSDELGVRVMEESSDSYGSESETDGRVIVRWWPFLTTDRPLQSFLPDLLSTVAPREGRVENGRFLTGWSSGRIVRLARRPFSMATATFIRSKFENPGSYGYVIQGNFDWTVRPLLLRAGTWPDEVLTVEPGPELREAGVA